MPIYEYECHECGNIEEFLTKNADEGSAIGYLNCTKCGGCCSRVISTPHFRVTGANAINGYSSIPTYDEVIGEDGRERKQWGKK